MRQAKSLRGLHGSVCAVVMRRPKKENSAAETFDKTRLVTATVGRKGERWHVVIEREGLQNGETWGGFTSLSSALRFIYTHYDPGGFVFTDETPMFADEEEEMFPHRLRGP